MKIPNFQCHRYGVMHLCYKKVLIIITMIGFVTNSFSQQLAFPTAEGFGRYATGGRGGSVIKVTNLNNSGSGSLRAALESSGTRTIVFDVGGIINLTDNIYVSDGNFTLAGQTAPGDGVLVRGAMVQVQRSNAIIRHMRFRPGPTAPNGSDALNITAWGGFTVEDIIIDHCSLSWGDDENFDIRAVGSGVARDITIQHSIISEAGKGALAGEGTFNKTYYKNLFAHNSERNIRTNYPEPGTFDFEMINNLIYGFRYGTIPSLGSKFTVLNNKYKESNQTNVLVTAMIEGSGSGQGTVSQTHAYLSGNILVPGTNQNNSALNPYLQSTPYSTSGIVPLSASEIEGDILDHVGASLPTRDQVDVRIVNQYINSNGTTASSGAYPTISAGSAPTDTDNDGMPDFWETANNLNISDASDRNIVQADGYTNLEYYLNGMSLTQQVNAGEDQISCSGNPVTLTASGAESYEWNTGATSASITVTPDTTTTYSVTGTHGDGSTTTDSVTVTVNQFPIANAGTDQEICEGESVTLTASGGNSYEWNTGDTTQSITVNPNTTTTYSVEVTTTEGCSATDQVIVTVNALPTANAGNDVTINDGESTTLTASGGGTYEWNTGATTQSITVSPNTTTTYSVIVTSSEGCTDEDFVTVTVNTTTVIANAGEDQAICEGESATLTASGGSTYLWNTGATTQSITVSPNTTTTYTVTVSEGSVSDSDSVIVTVNTLPTADAGTDQEICAGESVTLNASGGNSYEWNTGATTQSITVNPNTTTTYSVEVTSTEGCSATDQVIVTVNALPTANAGNDVTINDGESTTLTASGGGTYEWNTGATTQSITVSPNITTTYSVIVTSSEGCTDEDTVTVTVNGTTVIANAGEDQAICEGESATLTASGGSTYLWNTGATTQSITVGPNTTTTYTVTVSEGSVSDSDSVIVTVNALPTANAGNDVTINDGESTTLTATGGGTYEWNTGATTQSITVSPNTTTIYSVTVTSSEGCTDEDTITVTVNGATVIANAGEDQAICEGESATLTASGGSTYVWNTGATTQSITVSPNTTTIYTVTVSEGSVSDSDSVTVTVNALPTANAGNDVTINDGESTTLTASGGGTYEWNTGATTQSITVSPTTTTTYSVTVTSNEGCTDEDTVTVNVNTTTVNANAGEDQAICEGTSTILTATGGSSYLWSTGATTQSITVFPNATTTYTVTVSEGNVSDTDSVVVTVNTAPNTVIVNGDEEITILNGEFITISAEGAETYLWFNGATDPNIAISPSVDTVVYVEGFENNCSSMDEIVIRVVEAVEATVAEPEMEVCLGQSITLTAFGGEAYLWSNGEATQSITVSPEEDVIYTVTVSDEFSNDEAEVSVTVEDCDEEEIPPTTPPSEFKFILSPNPAGNFVHIDLGGLNNVSNISVFDILGKQVYSQMITSENGSEMRQTINVSSLALGVYLVKLQQGKEEITKRLVVNR